MNSKKLFLSSVLIISLISSNYLSAQSTINDKSIETVVNLIKFIRYTDKSNKNSKNKILYILTDKSTPINFEIKTRSKFNYTDWQVICSETINNIPTGSVIFLMTKRNDKIKKVIKIPNSSNFPKSCSR